MHKKFYNFPFSNKNCDLISEISETILKNKNYRKFPDLVTFAFWCRKNNIKRIKSTYHLENRVGRGEVFHITPSNVPLNFAYSFSFSFLAGNSNIVKVSNKNFEQSEILIKIIKSLFKKKKYKEFRNNNKFIRYKDNEMKTKILSKNADVRMIWGGDSTIYNLKKLETNPKCLDLTFPDRNSLSVINVDKLKSLSKKNFDKLVDDFYNDTYLYNQFACSSPSLIIWVGLYKNSLVEKFWKSLNEKIKKNYKLEDKEILKKYENKVSLLLENKKISFNKLSTSNIYRFNFNKPENDIPEYKVGYGAFIEIKSSNLKILKKIITKKHQTLTYFGFEKKFLKKEILNFFLPGIDRIVPIGNAIDMDIKWDGHDLIYSLTRYISD